MDLQGLTSVADLSALRSRDARDVIKGWIRQQQTNTMANWNAAALGAALVEIDLEKHKRDQDSSKEINLRKIDTGLGYYDWSLGFENYVSAKHGVQGKLDYVVCRDKPIGWN
eukprot:13450037-Ditylum_brightwellii.AAC.1